MIEKMKFLSITGPKADIDRMTETYLSKYEIHLENALSELTEVANLSPFLEINLTKRLFRQSTAYYEQLEDPSQISPELMDIEKAIKTVRAVRTDSDAGRRKVQTSVRACRNTGPAEDHPSVQKFSTLMSQRF